MDINTFFKKQNSKNQVKILTCGSVDDGKSTLIGRLLFDSKSIFHDQISQLNMKVKNMELRVKILTLHY